MQVVYVIRRWGNHGSTTSVLSVVGEDGTKFGRKRKRKNRKSRSIGGLCTTLKIMKTCPSCNENLHNKMRECPSCGLILEEWEKRQTIPAGKIDASMPIYASSVRAVSKKKCYRIYTDRVELDCPRFFKKTFIIHSSEIVDIWASAGTTLKDVPRLGGLFTAWRCLKLDLADVFRHVVLKSDRAGYFKSFAFVPEKPDEFVDMVKKRLLSSSGDG
jgi:hypothetical protein